MDCRTKRRHLKRQPGGTLLGRMTWLAALALLAISLPLAGAAETFSQPADDVWLGGPPDESDLDELKTQGVEWVIDLRTPEEDIEDTATAATARGMRYVNVPLGSEFADDEVMATVSLALDEAREAGAGVLLHCASGNRAGEVWALHRVAEGADTETALAEAEAAGTRDERLERLKRVLEGE